MTGPRQDQPTQVAARPTQAGDIRDRWSWVEATVWSDRMLAALEQGVKGGVWFSLIDHQRWPNAFSLERGYYSLVAAHREIASPRPG
jgi:hypothetical protein